MDSPPALLPMSAYGKPQPSQLHGRFLSRLAVSESDTPPGTPAILNLFSAFPARSCILNFLKNDCT